MARSLTEPFASGQTWAVAEEFNAARTRAAYAARGQEGYAGLAWGCPIGTPVYAMAAGTVAAVGTGAVRGASAPEAPDGNWVRVESADAGGRYALTYAHLAAVRAPAGARVARGDLLGASGATGACAAPRLQVRYQRLDAQGAVQAPDNGFGGAQDCAPLLDTADGLRRAMPAAGARYAQAPAGGPTVPIYGAPRGGTWPYARGLAAGTRHPLVGGDAAAWGAPEWWQIDAPDYPAAWVRRAETEVVDAAGRPAPVASDRGWTWWDAPDAPDARAQYLRARPGTTAEAYAALAASGSCAATLAAGVWYPILDGQVGPAAADGTRPWYRIRYGAAAGDEGWVRGDAAETRAYLPAGAPLYEPVPPAGPYLQAKAGLAAPVDVRAKPTRARTPRGFIAANSRQRYRIEGRNGARRWGWWQIDFHGDIGWVHKDLVDAYQTETVPWTWHPYVRRAPGETELVLRAGPGTAYAVRRRVRGDAARLHYVKNKDAEAPAWWRVSTYEWVQNDHVQVQGDPRRVVRAAAPALGESGPPYAQQAADAPVRVHQAPGRQRAVVTFLDRLSAAPFRIVGRQTDAAGAAWWQVAVNETLRGWVRGAEVTAQRGAATFTAPAQLGAWPGRAAAAVRAGPGAAYARVGALATDGTTRYALLGRDAGADWWRIQFSATVAGWVRGADAELHGDLRAVAAAWTPPQVSRRAGVTAAVAVRAGPGAAHARVGGLAADATRRYAVAGKDATPAGWWQIRFGAATGWVRADRVQLHGAARDVPATWTPAAVTALAVTARGPRALAVGWQAPASGPAPTGYAVQFRVTGAAAWIAQPPAGAGTTALLAGLAMGAAYDVRVRATRGAVTGAWTAGAGATARVPQVSLLAGATAAADVRAGPGATYARVGLLAVGSTARYDVAGKDAATAGWWQIRYRATVAGWVRADRVQTHGATGGVAVTWLAAAAGPLTLTVTGPRTLTAAWTAPTGTAAPTGYEVQFQEPAAAAWTAHPHAGTGTQAALAGLAAGTAYAVRVRATRGALRGPWATGRATTTAAAQASLPAALPQGLPVRAGPGPAYPGVGVLAGGTRYDLLGRDATPAGWWQLRVDATLTGWAPADAVRTHGDVSGVAVTWTLQAVRALGAAAQGARALRVAWQAPAQGPAPTGYAVQSRRTGAAAWTAHPHAGAARHATLTGLTPGATYAVRVRAARGAAHGAWTVAADAATPALAQLSLKTDATQAAPVRAGPAVAQAAVGTLAVGAATRYEITGRDAEPAAWWRIRFGDAGTGWVSAAAVRTHGAVAGVPRAWDLAAVTALTATATGSRALAVAWQVPASGPAPTGYEVQFRGPHAAGWTHGAPPAAAGTTAALAALTPGAAYRVRVRAARAAARGPWQEATTTLPAVPQLSLRPDATRDAVVRAGPGADQARLGTLAVGAAVPYEILGKDAATPGWWQLRYRAAVAGWVPADAVRTHGDVSAVAVTWTLQAVRGLATEADPRALTVRWAAPAGGIPPEDYAVRYRPQGQAAWTTPAPATLPAVRQLAVTAAGPRALTVTWQAPARGPAPTGYDVQYRARDAAAWKPLSHAGTGVAATVPALTPATTYDVRVRATHGAAQGPWVAAQGATAAAA